MILRAIGIVLLAATILPAARACSCSQAPPGKCPGLQKEDVVFLGTVIAIEEIPTAAPPAPDPSGAPVDLIASRLTRYHFQISEKFAGPDTSEIDVFAGGDDADCAFRFKMGERYVVFTQQETENRLFATICNGTRLASDARALLPQLRAMRNGQTVASVFGALRRTNPPFLAPPDDPDDPVPNVSLKLRSRDDRFETSTDSNGIYSFYDVHAGEYSFTANLPPHSVLTQKTLSGGLPPFKIPDGACYEYDVDQLPTGHIHGSVLAPSGKPLALASVELYRAGGYEDTRPGLWGFQGSKGAFDFEHVGPGDYVLVFNRGNRMDPNSPFPRTFYPGAADESSSQPIHLKDGQDLQKVNIRLKGGYPTRQIRVQVKWQGNKPQGSVTVMAQADRGENPAAQKIGDDLYQFTLLEESGYSVSAWEDLAPQHAVTSNESCPARARIDAPPIAVLPSDSSAKSNRSTPEVMLIFPTVSCEQPIASAPTP